MWESIAQSLVLASGIYVGLGLVVGLAFVTLGVQRIDPAAQGGSWGFRCLIFPGCVALWPLMLMRWMRAGRGAPEQNDAHRRAAQAREAGQ